MEGMQEARKLAMDVCRYYIRLIYCLAVFGLACTAQASTTVSSTPGNAIVNTAEYSRDRADRLWVLLQRLSERLQARMQVDSSPTLVDKILTEGCETSVPGIMLVKALQAEAKDTQRDVGLSIRGAYTSDNLSDSEGDANAYLELSWDVLRQGYKENSQQAAALYRQARIERLRGQQQQLEQTYRCRRYQLNQTFVGLQAGLTSLKLEMMEPVYEIERRAYFKGWSYLDELLVSEQDIRMAREQLQYLNNDTYWEKGLGQSVNPAVIDVDLQAVIQAITHDQQSEQISQLQKQSLAEKLKYKRNDRLRVFLRKEFDVGGNGNQDGVVAGVRFTIPIEKKKQRSLDYRLVNVEESLLQEKWQRKVRARAAYEELREQKERLVKQQYRYLRSKERVRRVFAMKGLNQELELAAAVARVRNLFDAAIEMVKAKEELYRRVNEIFLVSRVGYQSAFIKIDKLQEGEVRARSGERSIYLWSDTFNRFANQQLLDFLAAKSIKRVLLSAGKKTDREKMVLFVNRAEENNVQVDAITGANAWFRPEHHDRAALVASIKAGLSGSIHLDIEPHTVAGYKQNKTRYLAEYLGMLRKVRDSLGNAQLSIAVPTHWPVEVYEQVGQLADKVYIMAYENKTTALLIRRVNKVLSAVDIQKAVVVLSVKEFEDEWQMEKLLNVLQRETGVYQFGFHQFRTYLKKAGMKR